MIGLRERLQQHRDAIVGQWCDDALSAYSVRAAAAFAREQDEFANPVGHSLRTGTSEIFDALVEDGDDAAIRGALDRVLSIRAVQQLPVEHAVGFLFHLKDLIRDDLEDATDDPAVEHELVALEHRIDRAAIAAFETYVAYRELLFELRIAEIKRSVPWVVRRRTVQ